jgi:hypothetical protein
MEIYRVIFCFLYLFSWAVESQNSGNEQGMAILEKLQLQQDKESVEKGGYFIKRLSDG